MGRCGGAACWSGYMRAYCRCRAPSPPVNKARRRGGGGRQLLDRVACMRRAISLLQNKGILRDNRSPSLPSPEKYKRTPPNDFTKICMAPAFFLYIFTFRKAIFVRRPRYGTREIALVLRWAERTVGMEWHRVLRRIEAPDCFRLDLLAGTLLELWLCLYTTVIYF